LKYGDTLHARTWGQALKRTSKFYHVPTGHYVKKERREEGEKVEEREEGRKVEEREEERGVPLRAQNISL
jgi:hypothetical protein